MRRPSRQQCLQDARGRALADRDAAREPDDVRTRRGQDAEERVGHRVAIAGRDCVEAEQPRQRQIDLGDLVEVEPFVDAAQLGEVVIVQLERRARPQRRPLRPLEHQLFVSHRLDRCRSEVVVSHPAR